MIGNHQHKRGRGSRVNPRLNTSNNNNSESGSSSDEEIPSKISLVEYTDSSSDEGDQNLHLSQLQLSQGVPSSSSSK